VLSTVPPVLREGGEAYMNIKRIMMLLTVVALMMAMLAMSVVPAFAAPPIDGKGVVHACGVSHGQATQVPPFCPPS
jgi:hypothetical protein